MTPDIAGRSPEETDRRRRLFEMEAFRLWPIMRDLGFQTGGSDAGGIWWSRAVHDDAGLREIRVLTRDADAVQEPDVASWTLTSTSDEHRLTVDGLLFAEAGRLSSAMPIPTETVEIGRDEAFERWADETVYRAVRPSSPIMR